MYSFKNSDSGDFKLGLFIYISVVVVQVSSKDGKLSNSVGKFHFHNISGMVRTFNSFNA